MIFPIDRMQYSNKNDKFYLFEFIKIDNINKIKYSDISSMIGKLKGELNIVDSYKMEFIYNLKKDLDKYIIFYQKENDVFVVLEHTTYSQWKLNIMKFDKFKHWFNELNLIDGENDYSKCLGSANEENTNTYINEIIKEIYNLEDYDDDCGLEVTKKLLGGNKTRGFDIDLFQYIPSTDEYILYEFLKRNNRYVTNKTAHPMRYCWTNNKSDNKMKFISLWRAKKYFSGKLYLISYSDNKEEELSVIDVLNLDEGIGFLEENKYCMNYNDFIAWLKNMNVYDKKDKNYLSDFKPYYYGPDFFRDWKNKKNEYGKFCG